MKRRLLPLIVLALSLAPSLSANPYTLQYGGRLAGNSGRPLTGPVAMTLNFFNSTSGNTLLATQSFASVPLTDGIFSIKIELSPASFESTFSASEVWIEVIDNTNGKTYPRQRFGAVPYAFKVPTDGLTLGYDVNGKLRVQGLGPAALPSGNPSDGQILKWKDGTGWEWGADNSGGTGTGSVDSVSILDASISNADIAANAAIAGSKIAPNFGAQNITTTGTITGDGSGLTNLPAGPLGTSIDGGEIAAGSISDTHVAAGAAINQSKISGLTTALAAREGTITAGSTAQYFKGDKTWATLDTAAVPENVNLYYTAARARTAVSAAAPLSYNSTTGEFTITSASGVSAGTISAAEFLSFSAKQPAITAASTVTTGSLTTALQMGVEINPYGTNAGESGELRFKELAASGSNYVGFKAPDTLSADKVYVLPTADGSVGQFLSTDGAGNLSWDSVGGAAGGTVTSITAGTGLSGGTITGSGTINLANTAVTPNSYTRANITVDAQGRLTAASSGSSVNLTSEVTGTLPLASGGTGATTAGDARTALGLGALATANSVDLATATTGSLSITSGGTGATTGAAARTNLGLGGLATLSAVGSAEITDDSIANADISASAAIADTKLATISTAGKVSNSATSASSSNTNNAIVTRDASGNFSAGTITAALIGNASTATSAGSVTGTVAITNGGTGATTAELARTALGLGSLATLSTISSGEITDASIANADISASAAIDASKLADGSVSSTEFQYINSLTSNAQTQLDAKASAANPSFTGVISSPLGAVGTPSYTFTGDLNTGIWSSAADKLDFSTAGANRMTIDDSGKVGLGTTVPNRLLSLAGSVPILSWADSSSTAGSKAWGFGPNANGFYGFADSNDAGGGSTTNWLQVNRTAGSSTISSVIFPNGNVGIGPASPEQLFHVKSSTGDGVIKIQADGEANNAHLMLSTGYAGGSVNKTGIVAAGVTSYSRADLHFALNSTADNTTNYALNTDTKMIVKNNGNVGIGTTNPTHTLQVTSSNQANHPLQIEYLSSNWGYRKPVSIVNSGGALSAYQVLVTVDTQALIGAGKMLASCADIRFVNTDGLSQLSYYLDSGCNTSSTLIWVLVPSISAASSKTIYVAYGKSDATSKSSLESTFPQRYILSAGQGTLSGTLNYDWFEVASGTSLDVTSRNLLTINARKIIVNGTINGNGMGYSGQIVSAGGIGGGPGGGPASVTNGGGGSYGGAGGCPPASGAGSCSVAASSTNGTSSGTDIDMGSGGSAGNDGMPANSGGHGGGAIKLQATSIVIGGTINANGTNGGTFEWDSAGGGGGSGGGIQIRGDTINLTGTLTARGGRPGNRYGAGGGGGRIKVLYSNSLSGSYTADVGTETANSVDSGGILLGAAVGSNGTSYSGTLATSEPTTTSLGAEEPYLQATSTATALFIKGDTGYVGIGTSTPSSMLHVNGSVTGVGAYNALSDFRYKKDIKNLAHSLAKILAIRGVSYKWKDEEQFGSQVQIGVIAQEIEKILPEVVTTGSDGVKRVKYTDLIPLIIEAMQEQNAELEMLKLESAQLKADSERKDAAIERLETESAQLKKFICSQFPQADICSN